MYPRCTLGVHLLLHLLTPTSSPYVYTYCLPLCSLQVSLRVFPVEALKGSIGVEP